MSLTNKFYCEIHHLCELREYNSAVLQKHLIIFPSLFGDDNKLGLDHGFRVLSSKRGSGDYVEREMSVLEYNWICINNCIYRLNYKLYPLTLTCFQFSPLNFIYFKLDFLTLIRFQFSPLDFIYLNLDHSTTLFVIFVSFLYFKMTSIQRLNGVIWKKLYWTEVRNETKGEKKNET